MPDDMNALAQGSLAKIADRSIQVGVIGMGYFGLPLAVALGGAGVRVLGFEVDRA
jgi:UDP-N-acetyl-D-glucosamine dehydrogenase